MNPYYNQNYTREEIQNVLDKIKTCVSSGKYTISLNEKRQENIEFINEYNIRSDKQKSILMQIEVEDFCHTLQNTKPGYEYEILYVFVPQVELYNADGEEETLWSDTASFVTALAGANGEWEEGAPAKGKSNRCYLIPQT